MLSSVVVALSLSLTVSAAPPAAVTTSTVTASTVTTSPAAVAPIDMLWGVRIPMRDGVHLNATVFLPGNAHDVSVTGPVVFTLTPYIGDTYQERASYFASHGFAFVLVDVRGRGNSEGTFDPFQQEAKDGYDVVEWLAKQPWCNGKVAMWGGSYAGFDQWLTAREHPPHLVTIAPAAAAYVGVDFPWNNQIFTSYALQWLTLTSGRTNNANLFGNDAFWRAKYRALFERHRAFRTLDAVAGNTRTVWQTWLAHPLRDAYWHKLDVDAAKIAIPVLNITGAYDDDQLGALTYYDGGAPNQYLVIGPWNHAGTRTPSKAFAGLTFGDAAVVDLNELHRQWYAFTMAGGALPEFLKGKRVVYYVIGEEAWHTADSLAAVTASTRALYLDGAEAGGPAGGVFTSGALVDHAVSAAGAFAGAGYDTYSDDPLDVSSLARDDDDVPDYLVDQRAELAIHGDGVVYHSAPFAEDTVIAGRMRAELFLSLDVSDADIGVRVYEVKKNGTAIALAGDFVRARYRNGYDKEQLVTPGVVEKYTFTRFNWFARKIAKGSRLRLVVQSPNTMYLEKNYHSGGVVANETAKDARTAHVKILHDAAHPSALLLPLAATGPQG